MIKICKGCGQEFTTNRSARDYCGYSCSNSAIARDREAKKIDVPATTVWSCGGGVQSTAIAALIYTGKLPRPDCAVMTDCGYEKSATWEYVDSVLIPKMQEVGVNLQIIKTVDYSNNNLFDKSNHLVLPAFTMVNGKAVKFKTHCNNNWKVRPVQRWLREQGVKLCENWIGISTDEAKRAKRKQAKKWFYTRYPLIEQDMTREDCIYMIGGLGWPKPPRTSCLMCPQQDDAEWARMRKNNPQDWQRALEIEKHIQAINPNVYLHRRMLPLEKTVR
ncbi:MAG: hypothetical protein M0P69_14980 [Bacteroidales bacterium]|jgi:hypothetical protein|nr:hypothetical protein [Bacteroidales bacterium]